MPITKIGWKALMAKYPNRVYTAEPSIESIRRILEAQELAAGLKPFRGINFKQDRISSFFISILLYRSTHIKEYLLMKTLCGVPKSRTELGERHANPPAATLG